MSCLHETRVVEAIYIQVGAARTKIAEVDYCPRNGWPKHGCDRAVGDPRREQGCPADFGSAWPVMVEKHPHAPYYFEKDEKGYLVPLGMVQP